jgi:hypothetical protein
MTYTLTISLRGSNVTTTHETAEDAQAEALALAHAGESVRMLSLTGPLDSVHYVCPCMGTLHDIADDMEDAEVNALDAWGCYA